MGNKNKKNVEETHKNSIESSEETANQQFSEPVDKANESEWLVVNDMNGNRYMKCANCGCAVHLNKGTSIAAMLKYLYCYNCGSKMIIRDAN